MKIKITFFTLVALTTLAIVSFFIYWPRPDNKTSIWSPNPPLTFNVPFPWHSIAAYISIFYGVTSLSLTYMYSLSIFFSHYTKCWRKFWHVSNQHESVKEMCGKMFKWLVGWLAATEALQNTSHLECCKIFIIKQINKHFCKGLELVGGEYWNFWVEDK